MLKLAQEMLSNLQTKVLQSIDDENVKTYEIPYEDGGITLESHSQYIVNCCMDIRAEVMTRVHQELLRNPILDPISREIMRHYRLCTAQAKHCFARDKTLNKILRYITGGENHPLCLYGTCGIGKSSIMAKAMMQAKEALGKKAVVVVRFLGCTARSSLLGRTLRSLYRQLSTIFPGHGLTIGQESTELCKAFPRWLELSSNERPLVIFMDSLESMEVSTHDETEGVSNIKWLPHRLPPHTRLVLATNLEVDNMKPLRSWENWPPEAFLEVPRLDMSSQMKIIEKWLTEDGRSFQPHQLQELQQVLKYMDPSDFGTGGASSRLSRGMVLRACSSGERDAPRNVDSVGGAGRVDLEGGGQKRDIRSIAQSRGEGLLVRLAYQECCRWKSYDEVTPLPRCTHGFIQAIFNHLENTFGYELVSHMFALLAVAKHGLTQREILDLLSSDEEVRPLARSAIAQPDIPLSCSSSFPLLPFLLPPPPLPPSPPISDAASAHCIHHNHDLGLFSSLILWCWGRFRHETHLILVSGLATSFFQLFV
ncbi:hypothetical protein CYMTET_30954 [Cymbomonas tetramitiformis]|uniref:AAA+ ATPase domain-containing protein n=1 Tax=Cymbomonas tetramitiformis TaxID=36881 RepID=A0AAE0KTM3_9CHLO|nr:hypothetical protein CYMTET_30954 [Cymbomonas tetramitiformis]